MRLFFRCYSNNTDQGHKKDKDLFVILPCFSLLNNFVRFFIIITDYISSASATVYPVAELIKVCKKHNVMVMVDGAHTPGQVALNLEELGQLGMDFFAGKSERNTDLAHLLITNLNFTATCYCIVELLS
jgi:hypothetical protein